MKGVKPINLNKFNSEVCSAQRGKQRVSVGQVAEINKYFFNILAKLPASQVVYDTSAYAPPKYLRFQAIAEEIAKHEKGAVECNIAQIKRVIRLSWDKLHMATGSATLLATLESR